MDTTIVLNAQYIKDLSFENPKSPYSLISNQNPQITTNLDISANQVHENTFEVIIKFEIKAHSNDNVIFILDLQYAGMFTLHNDLSQENKQMILLVNCPTLLFPYARRIISDITRDGNFTPLMLAPFDFLHLYNQRNTQ
jgi:preprotein translocase subunit SecB